MLHRENNFYEFSTTKNIGNVLPVSAPQFLSKATNVLRWKITLTVYGSPLHVWALNG
jgi:hypothetical protein